MAPLDDAQMPVYADVAKAVSCLDGRDDVMLDLLRQKHASRHAAAPHRAFNHFIAVLGTPVGTQALGDDDFDECRNGLEADCLELVGT